MSRSVNSFNNWQIGQWLVVSCFFFHFVVVVDATQNSSTTSRPLSIPHTRISRCYPCLTPSFSFSFWCQCVHVGDVSARLPIYLAHPLSTLVLFLRSF
jgi:hypothetical protein